jgi:L-alanine-DL-glutamate epimerase-like enolase superfamily enzyme
MGLKDIRISELKIPFRSVFKHHSASRSFTQSVLVVATDGELNGYGEGCPREYVTQESIATVLTFFNLIKSEVLGLVKDIESLKEFKIRKDNVIRKNHAGWCAIELALLDLFAKQNATSIENYIGINELAGGFKYSAVIGDEIDKDFIDVAKKYLDLQMNDFKIKINGDAETDYKRLIALKKLDPDCCIRLDANNTWEKETYAIDYLDGLPFAIGGIEEPLKNKNTGDLIRLAKLIKFPVILDESFCNADHLDEITEHKDLLILNLRVSKLGGLLNTLEIAEKCRRQKIRIIIGAQVGESSILTRAALSVANSMGSDCMALEGAFGTILLEQDITLRPLMFGKNGILRPLDLLDQKVYGLQLNINPGLGNKYMTDN